MPRGVFIVEQIGRERALLEVLVLRDCTHPFIANLHYSFQTPNDVYIVMDYLCGGDLMTRAKRLEEKGLRFSIADTKFYAAEIVAAIGFLHSKMVVIRDLKLENVMIDREGHIKLVDFGHSMILINRLVRVSEVWGTPDYIAPEMILYLCYRNFDPPKIPLASRFFCNPRCSSRQGYTSTIDWWAFGICLFRLAVGRMPFGDFQVGGELYEAIIKDPVKLPTELRQENPTFDDLLQRLLMKDPQQRLGGGSYDADEVIHHDFFVDIEWHRLLEKQINPPYVPVMRDDIDTSHFCHRFTSLDVSILSVSSRGETDKSEGKFIEHFDYPVTNLVSSIRPSL